MSRAPVRRARIERRERSSSPFFTLLVLLGGLALLWQALQLYSAHLGRLSSPGPAPGPQQVQAAAAASPATVAAPAAPTPAPAPLPEEIAGLAAADAAVQHRAIAALGKRRMTPELEAAIRAARPANDSAFLRADLACLRARLPDPAGLEEALSRLGEHDNIWADNVDACVCLLEVIAGRVEEDPVGVAEAVFPFALGYTLRTREPALRALSRARLRELTPALRSQIHDAWHPGLAVHAAFAAGAVEIAPEMIESWLRGGDPQAQRAARDRLVRHPGPAAARLLVGSALAGSPDPTLVAALRDREGRHHDALDELARRALDESEPTGQRQGALELLAMIGNAHVATRLAPLQQSADPVLRAYANATVSKLRP